MLYDFAKADQVPKTVTVSALTYSAFSGTEKCPSLGALFHLASGGKLPGTLHRGAGIWLQRPGKSTSIFWIECILFDISRSWHATGIDREACFGFLIFRFQIPSNHPSVHVPGKAVVGEVEASQLDYPLVITIFNGKFHYRWPFSIAMLVYRRVSLQDGTGNGMDLMRRIP